MVKWTADWSAPCWLLGQEPVRPQHQVTGDTLAGEDVLSARKHNPGLW